ncbi:hypothetical protein SISNIDRAFT_457898 [Sistotremastrum niveocremeum HHB9708]|uniref:Signal recognition particle subunit SRP68 n=1 Tax=Sistotremastrum niveocremeum HHB9708 TaxID=1314777 RepID=A0A164R997_9AGAM|nr:hypothetical protein SISNIDRAFT_457898 [Sistotremastrum niveocremeum HHB9708]
MANISIRPLLLANEERNAYGLRYNDNTRYRKHCANKVHRLRSTLKITHGKGRDFKQLPTISPENAKDGHLQLFLFETERLYAYSNELAAESLEDDEAKARRRGLAKHRRSLSWAQKLLSLCQDIKNISAGDLIESHVYVLILVGRLHFKRYEFSDALEHFAVAYELLRILASHSLSSRDQALANVFIDEISPEIRYSAHELGREKAYDIEGIVDEISPKCRTKLVANYTELVASYQKEIAKAAGGEKRRLQPVLWEGQEVPIRNPELVDVFLKVQDAQAQKVAKLASEDKKKNSRSRVAVFDALLNAWSDAEDVSRKLVEAQQPGGATSTTSVAGTRDIHFVHNYIVFQLLAQRTERDLLIVNALVAHSTPPTHGTSGVKDSAPVDGRLNPALVKLLDTISQSLNQMRTLSVVDESADLATELDARILYTKAWRCLYLARAYAVVPLRQYGEALALTQRAHIHLREATSLLSLSDSGTERHSAVSFYALSQKDVERLEADFEADELRYKTDWFAYNGGVLQSADGAGGKPKKPLFFDIALNYVDLDMNRLRERAGKVSTAKSASAPSATQTKHDAIKEEKPEPEQPAQSTLSSLLGGWWGRK